MKLSKKIEFTIIKSQNYKHAKKSGFPESVARKIAFAPHLNIGVFSLVKDSPCWVIWQKNLKKALKAGNVFGSEGLAMNISVYVDDVKVDPYGPASPEYQTTPEWKQPCGNQSDQHGVQMLTKHCQIITRYYFLLDELKLVKTIEIMNTMRKL